MNKKETIAMIREKILAEADALVRVADQMDETCFSAVELIVNCKGRVILTGLGKTGHIGKKIAASMASLGIPAFFVHSDESLHGDMGMITKNDVVIMISNSGKSEEIVKMLAPLKVIGPKTISITKNLKSPLAEGTDISILCDAGEEVDSLGLAPTTSTTAVLAVGDALAIVASHLKGFKKSDFALSHPGGALGQQLLSELEKK